jgi:hypothetical protein
VLQSGNTIGDRKKDETTKKPFSKTPLTDLMLNMFLRNGFRAPPRIGLNQYYFVVVAFKFSSETCHSTGSKG